MPPPYVAKARQSATGRGPSWFSMPSDPPPAALLREDWAGSEEVLVERFLPGRTLEAFIMGDVLAGHGRPPTDCDNRIDVRRNP